MRALEDRGMGKPTERREEVTNDVEELSHQDLDELIRQYHELRDLPEA